MKTKSNKKLVKSATTFKKKLVKLMDKAKSGKHISGDNSFTNIGDIADLIKVCNLIKDGDMTKATNAVNSLPVFCAQMLPNSIFNKLYSHSSESFYE